MAIKVTKGQIYVALYQKTHVLRNTIYVESFMLLCKSVANFGGYTTILNRSPGFYLSTNGTMDKRPDYQGVLISEVS